MEKRLGYIGLGKMGSNMVEKLVSLSYDVVVYDRDEAAVRASASNGAIAATSVRGVVDALMSPRVVWVMVPHKATDMVLAELLPELSEGDIIIDGGNSFFKDSVRRHGECAERGVHFVDSGVSGGPAGARNGACMMVGGSKDDFEYIEPLLRDLCVENGYGYMGAAGAGHFVKMVHNGIEYGMMQAIAEGFALMKESEYDLQLDSVADVYSHGSVIESKLVSWLKDAYEANGVELEKISGSVSHSGEGQWTVETAKEVCSPQSSVCPGVPIIEGSLEFRKQSTEHPSYAGKVLSALRNAFGGHEVAKK